GGVAKVGGLVRSPPVSEKEIFCKRAIIDMIFYWLVQTAIVVGLFMYGVSHWGNGAASTAAFLTLSFLELFHAFNVRSEGRTKIKDFFSNKVLLITVLIGIAVNVLLAAAPVLALAFSLTTLTPLQWVAVFGFSLAIVPIGEIYKAVWRLLSHKGKRREVSTRRRHSRVPESAQ
ncbi:MAG: cation transporting ATPase C-terminal domain-containing protein, partial [Clostridiales bacterium]|nr:cation transporting ATPase C-terminal domain-containing protein [Clostridiales bacterium]